ncbi:MAG: HAMP domain-containing histidine kinase [Desulfovibrio sp.]|nr:HAMP domain-containing histidine kinase [Desulfovibrio sp.]MBI4958473.1 HAMP domain-containing histidine kinase [Desulfovibrio sp.]
MEALRPYAAKLAERAPKAGKYLEALFRRIAPRTHMELSLDFFKGTVKSFWKRWYQSLWSRDWDTLFLDELWQQGFDSAVMGIDLQYMMLGEIKCRQFFLRTIWDCVPPEQRPLVASSVNTLLDLCMLIRAKGHAAYTARVAAPVQQGLFHQTRNPLTVIGSAAKHLIRKGDADAQEMGQIILEEALRLERMTRDISRLNAVELAEPEFKPLAIRLFLEQTIESLRSCPAWLEGGEVSYSLDPAYPEVETDSFLAGELFREVLINALEALPQGGPSIVIGSNVDPKNPSHLNVTIFGGGELPEDQKTEELFLPFNSSKPHGTGFGLPIAKAAARKCLGRISLSQADRGVFCTVKLPLKGRVDGSGLLTQKDF